MSDLNKKKKEKKVDQDYPLTHVPLDARRGLISISCVLIGFTFFTPTMASGASLGACFPFDQLVIIISCGLIILGVWSDIILGGTQIFWYAITGEYMGSLFSTALGMEGFAWKTFWILLWGLIMGVTALYGVKMMSYVSYVAIPAMAILMVLVIILALREVGSMEALRAITPTGEMTVSSAITVIVGTFASGGTQAGNWARFAKTAKTAFIAGLLGFLVGNGIMIFSGMLGGLVFGTGDLIELMISMGIIFWALLILTLNIWTTNNATAYAFGMAGAEMFNKPNKNPFIIGGIIIALLMAIFGISNYFIPALNLLGTFVPPVGGAIIGDFLFVYKKRIPRIEYVHFKTIRWAPVIAYVIACVVAYVCGQINLGIPALEGIVIAIVLVPVIHAILVKMGINDEHEVDENAEYV